MTPGSCSSAMPRAHHGAMRLGAAYYIETAGTERDGYNWVPESSRRARGFPVLAALRSLGPPGDRRPHRARLRPRPTDGGDARDGASRLDPQRGRAQPGARSGSRDSTVTRTAGDARTREVIEAVQRDGTCWLSGTTWRGRAAMRVLRLGLADDRGGHRRGPLRPSSRAWPRSTGAVPAPTLTRRRASDESPALHGDGAATDA